MDDEPNASEDKARSHPCSLYQEDIDRVALIQRHYGDDSFSKAVRRAIAIVERLIVPTDRRAA